MLRLVDRTPAEGERIVALGESMLDREQRGGVLMTIDVSPVRSVAGRAFTSISTLLGRAIAHEIGHLLLGSAEHPRLGLMRALWSHDELRGLKPAHWGFSAREAAQMRQTPARRSRAPRINALSPHEATGLYSGLCPFQKYALAAAMAPDAVGSGLGADQPHRRRRARRNRRPFAAPSSGRKPGGTVSSAAPVTLTTATDDRGRFVFVVIRSGEWRLTFEAPGFDATDDPAQRAPWLARPRISTSSSTAASLQKPSARWPASTPNRCRRSWRPRPCCYDEGRHDQAIAAYREIKARAPALSLVNLQIGNSLPGEEVLRRSGSRVSGSAEERRGRCERVVRDGSAEGSAGKCGRRAELVPESLGRGCGAGRGR